MVITAAIQRLQAILQRHGDIEVFFDCPHCKQAFTPGLVEVEAIVVNGVTREVEKK